MNILLLWKIPLTELLLSVLEVGEGGSNIVIDWSSESIVSWLWSALWWGNVVPLMAEVLLGPLEGSIDIVDIVGSSEVWNWIVDWVSELLLLMLVLGASS